MATELLHNVGNSPKQDYCLTMKSLEHIGCTDPMYGYVVDWRRQVTKLFDIKGNYRDGDGIKDLRQGLLELRYFRNVEEVWVEFTCPVCGCVEYVEWSLDNIDDENLLNKCEDCFTVYHLTLENVHVKRWIKKGA